jgi:TolB-like protein/DNA-binding winged helix-turn-helix (wHTH) protein/cytochrome c-type biogenesis protein CcmH/NrfG
VNNAFQLGPWLVQPSLNTISRNGTRIQLEPKVMSVLVCLAEHPGEPVSKEKLLQTVWSDAFVSEGVLTRSVFELRRAFEDEAKEPRVIQTIAKRGYCLVAPVVLLDGDPPVFAGAGQSETNPLRRHAILASISLLAVLLIGLGWLVFAKYNFRWPSRRTGVSEIRSLAVLPLENLSHDEDQEYFAEGLTDALITELSQIRALRVISRTSIRKYKGEKNISLPEIARELSVDGIVEGTVQRSGDWARITVQLIYAPGDLHLWARSYNERAADMLAIEQEIAKGVSEEIAVQLTPTEKARLTEARTIDPAAVEAYLKGKYHADQVGGPWAYRGALHMAQEFKTALGFYQESLNRNPNYVTARLARAWVWLNWVPVTQEKSANARADLMRVLSLDPKNAQAHLLLGQSAMAQDFDWLVAEREFKQAIELSPNLAEAHASYATYLDMLGRFDQASKEWSQVAALDPDNVGLTYQHMIRRHYDRVIELNKARIERNAYFMSPHWELGNAYFLTGRQHDAILEWAIVLDAFDYKGGANAMRRSSKAGGYKAAVTTLAKFAEERAQSKTDYVDPGVVAYLMGFSGNTERAFFWLQKSYEERDTFGGLQDLTTLEVDPVWDPIRQDPRFKNLMDKVGLLQ